ncbi:MAG: hypothetical protein OEY44_04935 [Candidatus Peregrinibacteria bacterium]|nr:hypothetical protein [Candidatus Peregrinibacteria bacterium]
MKQRNIRGSILIWTLLLGLSLATVFFFFAQRLNMNSANQRDTIQYQNARALIESYADYLSALDAASLSGLSSELSLLDGAITGTLSNAVPYIEGVLDAGASVSLDASFPTPASDKVKVEWDACPVSATEILEISGSPSLASGNCPSLAYENSAELTDASFTLTAPAGPVSYRVSPIGGAVILDNKWQLHLEMPVNFRRSITIDKVIIPAS